MFLSLSRLNTAQTVHPPECSLPTSVRSVREKRAKRERAAVDPMRQTVETAKRKGLSKIHTQVPFREILFSLSFSRSNSVHEVTTFVFPPSSDSPSVCLSLIAFLSSSSYTFFSHDPLPVRQSITSLSASSSPACFKLLLSSYLLPCLRTDGSF